MRNTEADTLDELIDDCTALPAEWKTVGRPTPEPRAAQPWQVDEANYEQVADLDAYV